MPSSRRFLRLIVLALLGASLTACHFHRGCHGGRAFHFCAPVVRVCR